MAPTVTPGTLSARDFDFDGVTLDVPLHVDNPWPTQGTVDANWTLSLHHTEVSRGALHELPIPASGSTVLLVPIRLHWSELIAATYEGIDAVPYTVDAHLTGHTALGSWTTGVQDAGELPTLRWPTIDWVDWRIDTLTTERAAATFIIDVQDVPIDALSWSLHVGTVPLAHGSLAHANGRTELPVVVEIGRGLEALTSVAVAGVGLSVSASLSSPIGPIPWRFERAWRPDGQVIGAIPTE